MCLFVYMSVCTRVIMCVCVGERERERERKGEGALGNVQRSNLIFYQQVNSQKQKILEKKQLNVAAKF